MDPVINGGELGGPYKWPPPNGYLWLFHRSSAADAREAAASACWSGRRGDDEMSYMENISKQEHW